MNILITKVMSEDAKEILEYLKKIGGETENLAGSTNSVMYVA